MRSHKLADNEIKISSFRGDSLYADDIPVEHEICSLCQNNCKINKVTVRGETAAFGFLCGRDYDTNRYREGLKKVFDPITYRKKVLTQPMKKQAFPRKKPSIGIPAALNLAEQVPLWKYFFNALGVETLTSEKLKGAVSEGRKLSRAEFCAPMNAFFGHVHNLADKCDFLFLPFYLEAPRRKEEGYRYYCYCSQFAPSLAAGMRSLDLKNKPLMPVIDHGSFQFRIELFSVLKPVLKVGYWEMYSAYETALSWFEEAKSNLQNIYHREKPGSEEINVVLLGRPYTVMEPSMNKRIPEIFTSLGVKTFYQDMLPVDNEEVPIEIDLLLKRIHWNYPARILESALYAARTPGLYPVYVTSFKCGPDSFTLEYFRRIMDSHGKPCLVLELDEHDSSVGYETRIEAAAGTFRNHNNRANIHKFQTLNYDGTQSNINSRVAPYIRFSRAASPPR